ncbi:MAG: hypothetical protein LBC76_06695, partial [Treponema sp.]|nr:hypothetical protein [Treponema sp.]
MILQGKGTAQGFAVGRIYIYNEKFNIPAESTVSLGKEQAQLDRYYSIKKSALEELDKIKRSLEDVDPLKAEIFDAHKEIVEDVIINEEIPAKIL